MVVRFAWQSEKGRQIVPVPKAGPEARQAVSLAGALEALRTYATVRPLG